MEKTNSILIKLSDKELRAIDDGWFNYIYITGKKISRSEYIRIAAEYMNMNVKDIAQGLNQIKEA